LAARHIGAEVYHVDSIKQVVNWSNRNAESSRLTDIRWVVEDAMKFAKRELKRGKKYNGIILDPPAFGHGPNGESWKLEKNIGELVKCVIDLLDEKNYFLIFNTYSLGFSSLITENLILPELKRRNLIPQTFEIGELYIPSKTGQKLPLGVFCRFSSEKYQNN
jgi:23S rRNA (cytosine1962-C5)-methyltransferase